MKERKNCYVVRVDDESGCTISRSEYVGTDLGFQVWFKQLQRGLSIVHWGKNLSFPYYFYPVQEG